MISDPEVDREKLNAPMIEIPIPGNVNSNGNVNGNGNGETNTNTDLEINTSGSFCCNGGASSDSYWCSYKFVEVVLCFLLTPIGAYLELATPFQRPIPFQSLDEIGEVVLPFLFDHQKSGETVSPVIMFVLALVIPFLSQNVLILCSKARTQADKTEAYHNTLCVYSMSVGVTQTLTNLTKLYVGYFRPIFFAICEPDDNYEECTSDNHHQARLSFPSGHASFSVCGLLLFSLFLEDAFGKTAYERNKAKDLHQGSTPRPIKLVRILSVLCYAPMLVAFFTCASRIHDNYHHPADVVGGALLGGTVASVVFGIWYVPLRKPASQLASPLVKALATNA